MKQKHFTVIFLLMIIFSAVLTNYDKAEQEVLDTGAADRTEYNLSNSAGHSTTDEVKSIIYRKNGVEAEYPSIISGGSEEERKKWNQILEKDFNKIIEIYSFQPFPELTPLPINQIPVVLKIVYEIKLNNDNFISVLYTASYNNPYSAHPSELVYATNIDKQRSSLLKLKDIVTLDKRFVKNFRSWDFIPVEKENEELNKAIQDYVANISDEELLMGFQAADNIGSGNPWGIYSYLTEDSLGISLGVPHYAGDHAEYEEEYIKLKEYLKQGLKL